LATVPLFLWELLSPLHILMHVQSQCVAHSHTKEYTFQRLAHQRSSVSDQTIPSLGKYAFVNLSSKILRHTS
jgi:hypothetical protein